ncbi:hypothetical protein HY441_01730 [Candidatus Microgenomates bacterium]|nr:hypothetical protein [Candidatus Microgenomates bacterium]
MSAPSSPSSTLSNKTPRLTGATPPPPKTGGKKKWLILAIILAVLILGGLGGWLLLARKGQEPSASQDEVQVSKVVGNSNGQLPYAPIDEAHSVSRIVDVRGGAISTTLAGGIKIYLIIPEGSVIENASISILPYQAMPSQASHGELSQDYGFGVQIGLESVQVGIDAYLVFDVSGGKASDEAVKRGGLLNRCNPNLKEFNPFLCSRQTKVPATAVVDKGTSVVTPIHTAEFKELIFTRNTIPTGIDGLIAISIAKGDVYVPQKLDNDLTKKFVDKTLGKWGNESERVEAAALAKARGIELSNEQLDVVSQSGGDESYQERLKAAYVFREYKKQVEARTATARSQGADEDTIEDLEQLGEDFQEAEADETSSLYQDAEFDTRDVDGGSDSTQEAAAASEAATEIGFDGASENSSQVESNLSGPGPAGEDIGDTRARSEATDYTNQDTGSSDFQDFQDQVADQVNETLNNPNASASDLLDAAAAAQAAGLDNADQITEQVKSRIEDQLEAKLNDPDASKEELLEAAALAQALGLDVLADQLLAKAATAKSRDCDLIKKSLATFGLAECP